MEAVNGKVKTDMDSMTQKSEAYIRAWQALSIARANKLTRFDQLEPEAVFTLPGGMTRQTKISFFQARANNGQIILYEAWEEIVPV
jgi:hypothetical protein